MLVSESAKLIDDPLVEWPLHKALALLSGILRVGTHGTTGVAIGMNIHK